MAELADGRASGPIGGATSGAWEIAIQKSHASLTPQGNRTSLDHLFTSP